MSGLRRVKATAYVTPLREGGSLPALLEADDDGIYVTKFRGAGQGMATLVAEVIVGELGRRLGVRVPELVIVDLDSRIAPREPDEEIQDLLKASTGANLGLDFLPGSTGYDGLAWTAPPRDAALVLWLDAFTANVDRTWRNPNLLIWHGEIWAIDQGAALVFQHSWPDPEAWATRVYDMSKHVLLPPARQLSAAAWRELDVELAEMIDEPLLHQITDCLPDEWLLEMNSARSDAEARIAAGAQPRSAREWRDRYIVQLLARLSGDRPWQQGLVP